MFILVIFEFLWISAPKSDRQQANCYKGHAYGRSTCVRTFSQCEFILCYLFCVHTFTIFQFWLPLRLYICNSIRKFKTSFFFFATPLSCFLMDYLDWRDKKIFTFPKDFSHYHSFFHCFGWLWFPSLLGYDIRTQIHKYTSKVHCILIIREFER